MKLKINHHTTYQYDDSVSLGIHKLYLLPQHQSFQSIIKAELSVVPAPAGRGDRVDLMGNSFAQVWFDSMTDSLQIQSELIMDCTPINPFSFIIEPYFIADFQDLRFGGFEYRDESVRSISGFIHSHGGSELSTAVNTIRIQSNTFLDFLVNLTASIHRDWQHLIRDEEDFWEPDKTFLQRNGSCRDLAWMQMNMLGSLGLATRFVSGYAFNPELESGHELHAWLETYLPGAGWVGLDPSLGLLTNQLYVPLAFHSDPAKTLPVQGSFAGKAKSKLETSVTISLLSD